MVVVVGLQLVVVAGTLMEVTEKLEAMAVPWVAKLEAANLIILRSELLPYGEEGFDLLMAVSAATG